MSRVTDRAVTPAALRKRRQRAREAAARDLPVKEVEFTRAEWALFVSPDRLPQKAGCSGKRLRAMVLKELIDNALDAGATATLAQTDPDTWLVTDDGPGLDRGQVLRLFAVDRPMVSTKLVRRPTRGAIGNGLRVVLGGALASRGRLVVESRGRWLGLDVDRKTGRTLVAGEGPSEVAAGTRVTVTFGEALPRGDDDGELAMLALHCDGPAAEPMLSHPSWHGPAAFAELIEAAEPGTSLAAIARLFGVDLDHADRPVIADDLTLLTDLAGKPPRLLPLGDERFRGSYAKDITPPEDGRPVPVLVEAWATAVRCPPSRGGGAVTLLVNRSPVAAPVHVEHDRDGRLCLKGCGLFHIIGRVSPGAAYRIHLAVTAPAVPVVTDGKEPDLEPLWDAIEPVLGKAMRKAYGATATGLNKGDQKAAAEATMVETYETTVGHQSRANARQLMYTGRRLMGPSLPEGTVVDDNYFIQHLLVDFIHDYPKLTEGWNVDYDDRGHLTEPHTGRMIPCGTAAMEEYLRPVRRRPEEIVSVEQSLHDTQGRPKDRYSTLLFIEKAGFSGLLAEAKLKERFDCAVVSSQGMSVVAVRQAVEECGKEGVHILVAHDFDRAGAAIAHTLAHNTRRHNFTVLPKVVDIGLSLADARRMRLDDEAAPDHGPKADKLRSYGRSEAEIDFLIRRQRRYELNAMTSDQFVDWIVDNLIRHGGGKVVPDDELLAERWRTLVARKEARDHLPPIVEAAKAKAAAVPPPEDLRERILARLAEDPTLCWDDAEEDVLEELWHLLAGPVTPAAG